jgi:hypothetical protein
MTQFDFIPKPNTPFAMSARQIASWFCDIHDYWFSEPGNQLFGLKGSAIENLVRYLLGIDEPPFPVICEYVINKFREVEDWFERKS